jgi:hypothetical protein
MCEVETNQQFMMTKKEEVDILLKLTKEYGKKKL